MRILLTPAITVSLAVIVGGCAIDLAHTSRIKGVLDPSQLTPQQYYNRPQDRLRLSYDRAGLTRLIEKSAK